MEEEVTQMQGGGASRPVARSGRFLWILTKTDADPGFCSFSSGLFRSRTHQTEPAAVSPPKHQGAVSQNLQTNTSWVSLFRSVVPDVPLWFHPEMFGSPEH